MDPDGEDLDAYILKVDKPVEKFTGIVVAIVHRTENDNDKLVVVPGGETITDDQIESMVSFQEKWFKHEIIRRG
jgi:inorganic pyrophosphatase